MKRDHPNAEPYWRRCFPIHHDGAVGSGTNCLGPCGATSPRRRDYAVVAEGESGALTELSTGAAALFEEVAVPRTVADLTAWLGLDDSAGLESMIAELHAGGVVTADGRPTVGGSSTSVRVEVGADPRGVVLAHGLSQPDEIVIEDPGELLELLEWAMGQRVVPLLAQAVHDGSVAVPAATAEAIVQRDRAVQRSSVAIEIELLSVAEVLDRAGLGFVLLKGLATGHLDYPSPAWRQTGDVDLLLSAADVASAVELLVRRGAVSVVSDEISTLAKATTVRMPSGVEIDLHARPVMLPYGAVGLLPTVPCEIGGVTLQALARPDRWAHAVAHHALSAPGYRRASSLCDVLATWPTPDEHQQWGDAIARWRATTLLHVVERDLADLGISIADPGWLEGLTAARPRFYERELVEAGDPGPILHWIGPLSVLDWRGRARHLKAMSQARWQRTHRP